MTPACKDCRWWQQSTFAKGDERLPATYGECRALAPNNQVRYDHRPWPQTQKDDWCGEFDERPEPRMDAARRDETMVKRFDVT